MSHRGFDHAHDNFGSMQEGGCHHPGRRAREWEVHTALEPRMVSARRAGLKATVEAFSGEHSEFALFWLRMCRAWLHWRFRENVDSTLGSLQ